MDVSTEIRVQGMLSLGDLARFHYFHTLRRLWPFALLGLVVLLIIALLLATSPAAQAWAMFMNFLPGAAVVSFWLLVLGVSPYLRARKQLTMQAYLNEPVKYVFTAETISATGANLSWTITWSVVKYVRETRHLFLLYHAANVGVIVPKRFFESPAQAESWRRLVIQCAPSKRIENIGVAGRWC